MSTSPYPLRAQVLDHDVANDAVYVQVSSGPAINFSVGRLYSHTDGVRISKKPLPSRGSWVLLTCPGGDIRQATMIGAYNPNLVNPLTSASDSPFDDYESYFAGGFDFMNGNTGEIARTFADNSTFVMGSGLAMPPFFRNTVDENQMQQKVPFTQAQRNPNPQKPFALGYTQSTSGTDGGTNFSISSQGNVLLSGTVTHSADVIFGGAHFRLDPSGDVQVTPGASTNFVINGNLHVTGEVIGGFGGDNIHLTTHKHSGVTAGPDDTGQPVNGT